MMTTSSGRSGESIQLTHLYEEEAGDHVTTYALDSFFKDQKVDFIKADIEGSEKEMLLGAKTVIQTNKPTLALCVYHKTEDFLELPLLLHRYAPEYTFRMRHHTYRREETVLYAFV